MTLAEMIAEVKRILAYDGQLADAGASVDTVIRNKLSEAVLWWVRAVRHPWNVVSVAVTAGSRDVDVESTSSVVLVFQAWWQGESDTSKRPLVQVTDMADLMMLDFFATGDSPSQYLVNGGRVTLHPTPSAAGTLIVWGVQGKKFTAQDDPNEVTVVPLSGQQAVCLRAAAMYLMPYTELAQKATQYLLMADKIAQDWRGDAAMAGLTGWQEKVSRWPTMP